MPTAASSTCARAVRCSGRSRRHLFARFAQLGPGDTLVLYTDGITECHHHLTDEEFGLARLQSLVRRHAKLSAAEITQTIFHAVSSFAGRSTPVDDQTVLIVRRPAAPEAPVVPASTPAQPVGAAAPPAAVVPPRARRKPR